MTKRKQPDRPQDPAAPVPAHPDPKDPAHEDWLVDEASDESFPASDPSETAMPHPRPGRRDKPQ